MLTFDGKDWSTVSVPDGKIANLTASLPAKFSTRTTTDRKQPGLLEPPAG
jgi:hypothetical protein